ncbi:MULTISPECIES: hypothetical protein [Acidobacteriaceae]|uniref:hypothetical protein n=1 Tax=Acidobacteriaceae TaxID=204434 RepID=UPI00131B85E3|nr:MULTISPECIES: hypothetical protein [Acidobacteriaceae]MDW5266984.1 hypothetical protein [Edaphobacter sp.]
MQGEDQYQERTPDLVGKICAMREAAEKEMNRFTRVADYDVRRVVGYGPTPAPASGETSVPTPTNDRPKRHSSKSHTSQASIEFAPAPTERGDGEEGE